MSSERAATTSFPSHLWVEITDAQTGYSFFANPSSGECCWERRPDMTVMPKDPDGEWWELFDEKHELPYYYHTTSGRTEWLHPSKGTVIPLILIQKSAIGKRVSVVLQQQFDEKMAESLIQDTVVHSATEQPSTPSHQQQKQQQPNEDHTTSSRQKAYQQLNSTHSKTQKQANQYEFQARGIFDSVRDDDDDFARASSEPHMTRRRREDIEPDDAHSSPVYTDVPGANSSKAVRRSRSAAEMALALQAGHNRVGPDGKTLPPIGSGSLAGGAHHHLPPPGELRLSINQFRIDGFARKYFATHKKGLLRRKVPVERMLEFQKDSLKIPLLVLSKNAHRDALKTFKLIQRVMGDRPAPTGSRTGTGGGTAGAPGYSGYNPLEDIQWILERGITLGDLRDEIYVQLCKQLTKNPREESRKRGWQVMATLVVTFPPSRNFEDYLKSFLLQSLPSEPLETGDGQHQLAPQDRFRLELFTVVNYCLKKLYRICKTGRKGKTPTLEEVDRFTEAPFFPSVFGESLSDIMGWQRKEDKTRQLPKILPFLAKAILDLGGEKTEGIFRVPGDADMISEMKLRIEKGNYDTSGVSDPNIPASLLKFWMRDLADPLIPESFYDDCIGQSEDLEYALQLVEKLPEPNRAVVKYMVMFLQRVSDPKNHAMTKMTVANLAMVFAPNFLRCPSENPAQIFQNTKHEQAFLRTLISGATYNVDVYHDE